MRILAIHEKTIALPSPVHNASIGFSGMTASAIVMVSDIVRGGKSVCGLAFDSIGRYGHSGLLKERFIPRIIEAEPEAYQDEVHNNLDPFKLWNIAMQDEKPGGHGERSGAVGLIDAAAWDLIAKLADKPLWKLLAERFGDGQGQERVSVYASTGHYHMEDDIILLAEEVQRCIDLGFKTVKIKAGAASISEDLRRIDVALDAIDRAGALAIDCNGMMYLPEAENFIAALEDRELAWIEEPVGPLDFQSTKVLTGKTDLAIATGENLFSAADTRNLLLYGGLRPDRDLLQMDISLSYGIVEYLKILSEIEAQGWSRSQCIPHAGHLLAFNAAAGLELGGHETSPSGNFAPSSDVTDGIVIAADNPGVGFEKHIGFKEIFDEMIP